MCPFCEKKLIISFNSSKLRGEIPVYKTKLYNDDICKWVEVIFLIN